MLLLTYILCPGMMIRIATITEWCVSKMNRYWQEITGLSIAESVH